MDDKDTVITPHEFSSNDWVHPFDRPDVELHLRKYLSGDLMARLKRASRPDLSSSDDLVVKGSNEQARKRLERIPLPQVGFLESIDSYTARVMYEESFAMVPVMKLGGILSHCHRNSLNVGGYQITEGKLVDTIESIGQNLDLNIFNLPLEEALPKIATNITSLGDLQKVLVFIGSFGIPTNQFQASYMVPFAYLKGLVDRPQVLLNGQNSRFLKNGWNFLQAYHIYRSELEGICEDEEMLESFNLSKGVTRMEALFKIWNLLGDTKSQVLRSDGTFKKEDEEGYKEGIVQLAVLRSSPDFSFLYKHLSLQNAIAISN